MSNNPYDEVREQLVEAMFDIADTIRNYARSSSPYDAVKLSDEQDRFIYDYPSEMYPGEGLSTGAASQRMLQEWGPAKYVEWVLKHAGGGA